MELKQLGSTGLKVSAVGIGCNNFGMRCEKAPSAEAKSRSIVFFPLPPKR